MKRFACVVAIILSAQGYASAGLIEYDTQSAFTAHANILSTDSFAGLDTSSGGYSFLGATVVRPNFTIVDVGGVYAVTSGFGADNAMPNGGTCVIGDGWNQMDATLATPCTAVGFDIFSLDSAATVAGSVTLSDGTTHAFTYSAGLPNATPPTYIGFVETTPGVTITKFSASDASVGKGYAFSNVSFGNAIVPEPTSLMLLATGLLGLMAYAWRKQK